ncbi:MAG TPA: S1 RNA-binding domain-containing protein [Acidimicrobiales bacterium]|nr:S1 RNA-binding domain-containing protein [Acidimicrobiales bacterium]
MAPSYVVVDGSNIATEGRSEPSLAQLDEAVRQFQAEFPDKEVIVVVDATFGHRIDPSERPAFDEAVAHAELVSPPAGALGRGDAFLLRVAERVGGQVLSNDSFQEFHGEHPWLFDGGRLIGGKPIPGVGWIFTPRNPVRGARSRASVAGAAKTSKTARAPRTAKATKAAKAPKAAKTTKAARAAEGEPTDEGGPAAGADGEVAAEAPASGRARKRASVPSTKAAKAVKAGRAEKGVAAKAGSTDKTAKPAKEAKPVKEAKPAKAAKVAEGAADTPGRAPRKAKAGPAASGDEPVVDAPARRAPGRRGGGGRARGAAVRAAIDVATVEAIAPPEPGDAADGGTGRRRRAAEPPPAVNDPLTFLTFVSEHPIGSTVEGEVTSFVSHGAMVDVAGMQCYVPLSGLGDPPPRGARQVMKRGDRRTFVLVALDPARRGAELALPEFAPQQG